MATTSTHLTLEQYEALPEEDYKQELLDGEVHDSHIEPWYQLWSQEVGRSLNKMLAGTEFEVWFRLGIKFTHTEYPTVLQPDVSILRSSEIPKLHEVNETYIHLRPLLVCETVYSGQDTEFLQKKIDVYRAGGVLWIWALDFENRKVLVEGPNRKEWKEREIDLESPLPAQRLDLIELFRPMNAD